MRVLMVLFWIAGAIANLSGRLLCNEYLLAETRIQRLPLNVLIRSLSYRRRPRLTNVNPAGLVCSVLGYANIKRIIVAVIVV